MLMNSARFCFFHFGLFWVVIFKEDGGGGPTQSLRFFYLDIIWIMWDLKFLAESKNIRRLPSIDVSKVVPTRAFTEQAFVWENGAKNDFSLILGKFFWALGCQKA